MPGGAISSWAAVPTWGWVQLVATIAILDNVQFKQDPDKDPGDTANTDFWVRYDDPVKKNTKLNVERNNGRAAMMGMVGAIWQEAICGNPLFPIDVSAGPPLGTIVLPPYN